MKLVDQIQEALISATLKHYRAQTRALEERNAHYKDVRAWFQEFPQLLDERRGTEDSRVLEALEETIASKQKALSTGSEVLTIEAVLLPYGVYLPVRRKDRVPLEDALLEHARTALAIGEEKMIHEYLFLTTQPSPSELGEFLKLPEHLSRAGVELSLCGLREYHAGERSPARVLYEKRLSESHAMYGLIPVPSKHQKEFPQLHQPFIVETPLGEVITVHTTTPGAHKGHGERFSGEAIKRLYTQGVVSKGSTIRVSVVKPGERYRLEVVN